MRTISYIVLFFLTTFNIVSIAQNYQPVQSNRQYLYSNGNQVMVVHFDSIYLAGTDSVFVNYDMIRDTSTSYDYNTCFVAKGGSVLSKQITIKQDGTTIFTNDLDDTLMINTHAPIGTNCGYFYSPRFWYWATAKMKRIYVDTIWGIIDSVKEIKLDNAVILISKKLGIISTPDLYSFPFDGSVQYDLIGMTNPTIGKQNLSTKNIYDFNIGDEFHITNKSYYYCKDTGPYLYCSKNTVSMEQVIDRIDYADSVVYLFNVCKCIYTYNDTICSTGIEKRKFLLNDKPILPNQLNGNCSNGCDKTELNIDSNERLERYITNYIYGNNWGNNDCLSYFCCVDPQPPTYTYIEGCGGPYFYQISWGMEGDESVDLVYYKKGNETWGTPVASSCESLITSFYKINSENPSVSITPNPMRESASIEISTIGSDEFSFQLLNSQSSVVREIKIPSNSPVLINRCSLNAGIYFYRVYNSTGFYKYGKMVIAD